MNFNLGNLFSNILSDISNWISSAAAWVIMLLPESPFTGITQVAEVKEVLGYVNYYLPVREALTLFQVWIAAIAVYYVYQVILRWIKAVE